MIALARGGTFECLHCQLLTPVTAKLITEFTVPGDGEFAEIHVPLFINTTVFRVPDQCNMQKAVLFLVLHKLILPEWQSIQFRGVPL